MHLTTPLLIQLRQFINGSGDFGKTRNRNMLTNLPNLVYKVKTLQNNTFKRWGNVYKPDQRATESWSGVLKGKTSPLRGNTSVER